MSNVVPYPIYIQGNDLGFKPRYARVDRAKQIIEEYAERHGVTVAAITGEGSDRKILAIRDKAIRQIRDECGLSMPSIGAIFGGRNHSTVLDSLKRTEARGRV